MSFREDKVLCVKETSLYITEQYIHYSVHDEGRLFNNFSWYQGSYEEMVSVN